MLDRIKPLVFEGLAEDMKKERISEFLYQRWKVRRFDVVPVKIISYRLEKLLSEAIVLD